MPEEEEKFTTFIVKVPEDLAGPVEDSLREYIKDFWEDSRVTIEKKEE